MTEEKRKLRSFCATISYSKIPLKSRYWLTAKMCFLEKGLVFPQDEEEFVKSLLILVPVTLQWPLGSATTCQTIRSSCTDPPPSGQPSWPLPSLAGAGE
jgi:hypothetical protein